MVTNITRVFLQAKLSQLVPANPWSPVLLTWFDSEQSPGGQILFQHCNLQVKFMHREEMSRTSKQQPRLSPSLPACTETQLQTTYLSIPSAKWPEEHAHSTPATSFSKNRCTHDYFVIFCAHKEGKRMSCHLVDLFRERKVCTRGSWITALLSHHMLMTPPGWGDTTLSLPTPHALPP